LRIVQISDTHISAEHADFADNAAVIGRAIAELKPDLVINTGDLSMNGCIAPVDLERAADFHRSLGVPVLSVPGNHDVGDRPDIRADQVLDDARLAGFAEKAGPDRWIKDIPGWRLIGLNAMLFDTGHREEEAQFQWLEEAVATDAQIAVFLHKPLFIDTPDEGPRGYWTARPDPRKRFLEIIGDRNLKLIASGHLHIARELVFDGVTHIWGPASSFVCGPMQEDLGGNRRIGLVAYTFFEDGFSHHFIYPAGAHDLQLDPVASRLYPSPRATAAQ
jgi:3',5'-cyclic AMP phosphodiesterase CpdA